MRDGWILPQVLFDGNDLRSGVALRIEKGLVTAITEATAGVGGWRVSGIVSPGYVDLQVNGGGGVLVNAQPTQVGMERVAATHRRFGTVGILPTVITDAPEVLERAVEAALGARGRPGVLGLHIEGPHISAARRGVHKAEFVRPMDDATVGLVRYLRDVGIPVLITVAPEVVASDRITDLAEMGVVVSIGHTNATAAQARAAFDAGVMCATHLFNAMSPMLSREPGVVGAVINSDVYAGLIVDGIHVADEMIGLALRARPRPDRMFLVSDAMPTVGGPDRFFLYGEEVSLDHGRLSASDGRLAGAHLTIAEAVVRLVRQIGLDRRSALRMAITVPAELMGFDALSKVEGRPLSDLMCLEEDMSFRGWLDRL